MTIAAESRLVSTLVLALGGRSTPPTRDEVVALAKMLAPSTGYTEDNRPVVDEVLQRITTRMGMGESLVEPDSLHDEQWVSKRVDIKPVYAGAYQTHLSHDHGWSEDLIRTLNLVNDKVLQLLQDPKAEGRWDRRGLVIGHVQSGKTANYLGLIAKAADAGYKFIVVIAGIHNNLRRQTQERIDAGFIGRDSETRNPFGVGDPSKAYNLKDYPHPVSLTTVRHDFNTATANTNLAELSDYSKPVVLVIKKNVTTLTRLHAWLKDLNARGQGRIMGIPMLMIDDEADNASINTNAEDTDPTRTNEMIRKILALFSKTCYVGYTATPFANIFIDHEAKDDELEDDLFPRDFIYCLDAPTTYFGPDRVFLDDKSRQAITCQITDAEDRIPLKHRRDHVVNALPKSLVDSVYMYIVARAIRVSRGHVLKHCSMMINVSRFVDVQKQVASLVHDLVEKIKRAAQASAGMSDSDALKSHHLSELHRVMNDHYSATGATWSEIKPCLVEAFRFVQVKIINSNSQDSMDFVRAERAKEALNAIAVGGLSLSRGLTIEGLTISYMYRNTKMYDTLMQMGRWFGYRPGYEDLCRIHLNPDSINWYEHIAEASEELRDQIRDMRRANLSPKKFGLYVRNHPDSLMITAKNKMRCGSEEWQGAVNYSGSIKEMYRLSRDGDSATANKNLFRKFWTELKTSGTWQKCSKGQHVSGIDTELIIRFLSAFDVAGIPDAPLDIRSYQDFLSVIRDQHPVSDVLFVSLGEAKDELLGSQERSVKISAEGNCYILGKQRVASRGDEKIGLDEQTTAKAMEHFEERRRRLKKEDLKPSDVDYRYARNKPLLMLHYIQPKSENGALLGSTIPTFGISFPFGNYDKSVKVTVNKVWLERAMGWAADEEGDDDVDAD